MNEMTLTFVLASVFGALWAWLVWIVIGGLAGALADRWIQGDRLGIIGNVIVGILGGLIGGAILSLFGIEGQGIIWTFVTALLGAALLLWLAKAVTGGRGIGSKRAFR
jgi:uncharacterized membrane protein YeaQ/YmgE (transglycosylase-associated protein family)